VLSRFTSMGPTTNVHPWILQLDDGTKCAFVPGFWEIFDVASDQWRV